MRLCSTFSRVFIGDIPPPLNAETLCHSFARGTYTSRCPARIVRVERSAYSEDADLSTRTMRAGHRLVYVPRAKLWHKVSAFSGGGISPMKTRLKVEHNLIYFK